MITAEMVELICIVVSLKWRGLIAKRKLSNHLKNLKHC